MQWKKLNWIVVTGVLLLTLALVVLTTLREIGSAFLQKETYGLVQEEISVVIGSVFIFLVLQEEKEKNNIFISTGIFIFFSLIVIFST